MNFSVLKIDNINSLAPIMKFGCYGVASFLAGRKVIQLLTSGTNLVGSKVANYMNRIDLSESFQKRSTEYLASAKKNLVRDLAFAGTLGIAGFVMDYVFNSTELLFDPNDQSSPSELEYVEEFKVDYFDICVNTLSKTGVAVAIGSVFNDVKSSLLSKKVCLETGQGIYTCLLGWGIRNGQGTIKWPFGEKYVGEIKDYLGNGQGILTTSHGAKYEGEFKDGKLNGQGTYTTSFGAKYEGEFKDGKLNGQGTYTTSFGDIYRGVFKDNQLNGQGILYL